MSNINTFEQELELNQIPTVSAVKTRFKKSAPSLNDDDTPKKAKVELFDLTYKGDPNDKTNVDKLGFDANNKLNYYLKKMPQWQILEKQITILKTELDNYKKNGSVDNYQKTADMLAELSVSRKQLKSIFKSGGNSPEKNKEKRDQLNTNIKNSELIKELTTKKKLLLKDLKSQTPTWWVSELKTYRTRLNMLEMKSNKYVSDFDDELETKKDNILLELEQEYMDFCGKIADIINWDVNEVMDEKKLSVIKNELSDKLTESDNIKNEINKINSKISGEKDNLSGEVKITDILFNVFDFANDVELQQIPKEILILSNINYVKAIAYNICIKYGSLDKIEDAIGAGLLGLCKAVDAWYFKQTLQDSPLSFKGFSSITIYGAIQRELLGFEASGVESGSSKATVDSNNKKKLEMYKKDNPECADIDNSILIELLSAYDDVDENGKKIDTGIKSVSNVTTESKYTSIVSGEDGDSGDIWANASTSDDNVEELVEGKIEYAKMLKSISDLLNLFEMKVGKDGSIAVSDKKMFDVYDRKIFMMYFGLQHKIEVFFDKHGKRSTNNDYTQDEIREELFVLMKADGMNITKPISQSAVNYRINSILKKIKIAMDFNPGLKLGFEYFINIRKTDGDVINDPTAKAGNWRLNNPSLFNKLSNNREEINMKINRDNLKEIYSDNENALSKQMSDGKRLSDTFQVSDTNPLDDEIASLFTDNY